MKFAICNETFQDWPFDRAFAFAADCGYSGIELAPFTVSNYVTDIPSKQRAEIRAQAEAAGLEIIGLHWLLAKTEGFYLTTPDAEVRGKTAAYFGELARFCADLGGRVLVLGSPGQRNLLPGVDRSEATNYAAEVLRGAVDVLEETGVVLALEPLGPEWTDFLRNAEEAAELVRRIGSPQVRLHLDCKAMSSESTPIPELIRRHREVLAHFHANDPNGRGPGFGELDFVPILRTLGEIEYGGWVSVEVFDYEPGVERLVRESIDSMRACLRIGSHPTARES
jgi:sugar phosphate isomerase/epimerase